MDSQMKHTRGLKFLALATLALLLAALLVASVVPVAQADDPGKSPVLASEARPYGMSYGQWSAAWWQWALRPPFSQGALTDETGEDCGKGQVGPVWFLAGVANSSGTVVRNCKVPAGKALFFPVLNGEWENEGFDTPQKVEYLRFLVKGAIDDTSERNASLDGKPLPMYRVTSPVFFYTMDATDNQYGLKCTGTLHPTCKDGADKTVPWAGLICTGGPKNQCFAYPAVGDGYYVMLAPLSPGEHSVHFGGKFNSTGWTLDITYNLTIDR